MGGWVRGMEGWGVKCHASAMVTAPNKKKQKKRCACNKVLSIFYALNKLEPKNKQNPIFLFSLYTGGGGLLWGVSSAGEVPYCKLVHNLSHTF